MAVAAPRPPRPIGRVHWLGLWTLMRRELSRFLKEWLETVVAPVAATVMYLAVFIFALGPDRTSAEGRDLLQFVVPGIVWLALATRGAETTVFSIVFDKLEGMISDVLTPPLSPSEITAAYAVAGTTSALVTGAPVLVAAWLFVDVPPQAPGLIVLFAVGSGLMLALTGILVGLWADRWDRVVAFFGFLVTPLAFLSGTFMPVEALGEPFASLLRLSPIYYAIDGFRAGFLGTASAPLWLSLAVVAGCNAALWVACDRLIAVGYKLKP